MKGLPGFHDLREELLERVWTLHERNGGKKGRAPLLELGEAREIDKCLEQLAEEGLVELSDDDVRLSASGEPVARHVVRAHRLAARLLTDVLELPADSIEKLACRLEHAISPELADSLCTLLGHPPTSPDGRPVPRGACCEALRHEAEPVVRGLQDLEIGSKGRIVFIHPRFVERLDRLSALGMVPGTTVRVTQRHPSLVVQVGETTLALDLEVAKDIFVKKG